MKARTIKKTTTAKAKVATPQAKPKAKTKAAAAKKAPVKKSAKSASVTKLAVDKKTRSVKTVIKSAKQNPIAKARAKHEAEKKLSKNKFTEEQKEKILKLLELIVHLRRGEREGLGSFEKIDRILDEYNQHYKTTLAKFEAVTEYGMRKDPAFVPKNVFIPVKAKSEYEVRLYALLEHMWEGSIKYQEAFEQMNSIYMGSLNEKHHNHHHFEADFD